MASPVPDMLTMFDKGVANTVDFLLSYYLGLLPDLVLASI